MIDLHGKVAVITGASRGIGRGCALEMAKCGADVIVTYRSHPDEAEAVAEEICALGSRAVTIGVDVADRNAVETMVREGLGHFGKIDILVNNAAMSIRKPFLEITVEEAARTVDVCMWGVFHCSQVVARHMVARGGGGKILIISSVHAFIPYGNSIAYNTAKSGINNMGYTMATELAQHQINVNIIEPGWTDTPGERNFYTEEQLDAGGKQLPWGRLGTIHDIGHAAAFLCSSTADYITGACLRVDGGLWLPRYHA